WRTDVNWVKPRRGSAPTTALPCGSRISGLGMTSTTTRPTGAPWRESSGGPGLRDPDHVTAVEDGRWDGTSGSRRRDSAPSLPGARATSGGRPHRGTTALPGSGPGCPRRICRDVHGDVAVEHVLAPRARDVRTAEEEPSAEERPAPQEDQPEVGP